MMAGVGKFFLWLVGVLVAGALLAFGAVKVFPDLPLLESNSATSHSQIINAVERREQVVLLSLGIRGSQRSPPRGEPSLALRSPAARERRSSSTPSMPSLA